MAATWEQGRSADLGVALRRIVVGYRVVAAGWLGLLGAVGWASGDIAASTALVTVGLAGGWAAATTWAVPRLAAGVTVARWGFVAADVLVAAGTLLLPAALGGAAVVMAGGYPFSAVVLAAWLGGMPGALSAAVVLAAASVGRVPLGQALRPGAAGGFDAVPADLVSTALFYLLAAAVLAWGMDVLARTAEERDAAEAALVTERADRVLAEERAATAAHLHDSVLQTLALVQRRSGEPAEVLRLARAQEHALRRWLEGRDRQGSRGSLAGSLQDIAAEIEDAHRLTVEVVHVGDAALDEPLEALVAAAREALVNAAKHAGVDRVQVYAEVGAEGVAVFVRDRGTGFEPSAVPPDRRGLAHSVFGRVRAVGGRAAVRSAPGQGTEVELSLPAAAPSHVG